MALRTLADGNGRKWQIWDVHPTGMRRVLANNLFAEEREVSRPSVALPVTLQSGWLAFQCDGDARRLAPIPPDWESMPDNALIALLVFAQPARSRAG